MHDRLKDDQRLSEQEPGRASGLGRILRPGTLIKGKWRLDKLLGVGGMAVVYAATHRNGKRVAIKMLHQELSRNIDVMTRFLREGYLANAVGHPGVVSILDDDVTEDGTIFLVMELFEGETIERRWERKQRRLPVAETLSIASELLDVLGAAHAKGVVHRDIKPENIFLTRAGEVKVLDFGIARLRQISGNGMTTTQSGHTMGTPAFMSPEQARGRWDEVDGRSDLWAVGATMFSLVSGRFVHKAGTPNELLLAAMTRFAPRVSTVAPELAPEVAAVIDRALSFSTQDRWPDARAMQVAVKEAYAAVRGSRTGTLTPPRVSTVDPDETVATAAVNLESLLSPTIGQGVANAPSAAPAPRVSTVRRSPIYVGISAGALGIALTLAAFVHRGAPGQLSAFGRAHAVSAAVVATRGDEAPVPLAAARDAGLGAELAAAVRAAPSPPATGVPRSFAEANPVPSAPLSHRPIVASSSLPEAKGAAIITISPSSPSPPISQASPADDPAHAADLPRPAEPPAAAAAPEPPPAEPTAGSEGLLDRRH